MRVYCGRRFFQSKAFPNHVPRTRAWQQGHGACSGVPSSTLSNHGLEAAYSAVWESGFYFREEQGGSFC
jgi:hypothetical protein